MSADTTNPPSIPGEAWRLPLFSGMAWDIMGYHGRQSILGGRNDRNGWFFWRCVKGLWVALVKA